MGGKRLKLTNLSKPFWPKLGDHEAGPARLLRRRRARPAAAPARSGDGDEALSQRRRRRVLLHEAHALAAARLAPDVRDRARLRQRHRLSGDRRPCVAALGGQSRLHRPEPLVRALRRHRSAGLSALRSRPGPGRDVRARARGGAAGPRRASTRLGMPSYPKTTGSRGIHVYVPIRRGPLQKQVWTFAKQFAVTAGEPLLRVWSRPSTARRKRPAGPRARRLQPERLGPHARLGLLRAPDDRPPPCRRRSPGRSSRRGLAIEDFRIDNVPARIRRKGDLWKPLAETKGRFRLESLL